MREFHFPGLVIHDQDDTDVPWQSGEQVANAWPNAGFLMSTRLGHRRVLRDKNIIATCTDFIGGIESAKEDGLILEAQAS